MRIENGNRIGSGSARAKEQGGNSPAFQIGDSGPASRASSAAAAAPGQDIGALLALQSVEDPLLKKRRKVRRGTEMLDALDELKADLLIGGGGDERLNQLMTLINQAREQGDPGLDELLDDIELRARVELAKRGRFP